MHQKRWWYRYDQPRMRFKHWTCGFTIEECDLTGFFWHKRPSDSKKCGYPRWSNHTKPLIDWNLPKWMVYSWDFRQQKPSTVMGVPPMTVEAPACDLHSSNCHTCPLAVIWCFLGEGSSPWRSWHVMTEKGCFTRHLEDKYFHGKLISMGMTQDPKMVSFRP